MAGGATLGGAAVAALPEVFPSAHLPLSGGYAPAADKVQDEVNGDVDVTWYVETDEPVVAFTFDDGPGPQWTSMVLDILGEYAVPATFFMVGEHLAAHADVVRGRLDQHEVGNHSWSHPDLAELDAAAVERQITRTHDVIHQLTGREPNLFRPPYGHLGGSTLMAANKLGYNLVLWSLQMHEKNYVHNPTGQVSDIVTNAQPGQIVLAHDVGTQDRLLALRQLGAMFDGLRQRGLRFVTVSELLALRRTTPARSSG